MCHSIIDPEFEHSDSYKQFIKEMRLAISFIQKEVGVKGKRGSEKLKMLLNENPKQQRR